MRDRNFLSKFLAGALLSTLTLTSLSALAADLDGDAINDRATFRVRDSSASNRSVFRFASSREDVTLAYQWGKKGDTPFVGKFISAAGADIAVFRPGNRNWLIRRYDSTLDFANGLAYQLGAKGDLPAPADFNGDGLLDLAVFRPANGTWVVRSSTTDPNTTYGTSFAQRWGKRGDTLIPADYDGDGEDDLAVFRAGNWNVLLSSTNNATGTVIPWGAAGDIPVPGQYSADTLTDFAVFRPLRRGRSLWIVRLSTLAGLTSAVYKWGSPGDVPVVADWDGDSKTDLTVFRPSNATWYIRTSSSNYATALSYQFGATGDTPLGK